MFLNKISTNEIELSNNLVYGGYGFYFIVIIGLLFCMSMATCINEICNKKVVNFMAYCGKNSFYIMALHFICFKLIDSIIGLICKLNKNILKIYPISFSQLRIMYFVAGVIIPLLIVFFFEKVRTLTSCNFPTKI